MFFDVLRIFLDGLSLLIFLFGIVVLIVYAVKQRKIIFTRTNVNNVIGFFSGIMLAFTLCMTFVIIASVFCSNLANALCLDASVLWAIIASAAYLFSRFVSWLLPLLAPDFFQSVNKKSNKNDES